MIHGGGPGSDRRLCFGESDHSLAQKSANVRWLVVALRRRKKRFGSEKVTLRVKDPDVVISPNGPEALVEVCNIIPGDHESESPVPDSWETRS